MNFEHPIYGNEGLREMTRDEVEEYASHKNDAPTPPPPDPMTEVNIKLDKILAILGGGKNG